jgi:hypothetical protein
MVYCECHRSPKCRLAVGGAFAAVLSVGFVASVYVMGLRSAVKVEA